MVVSGGKSRNELQISVTGIWSRHCAVAEDLVFGIGIRFKALVFLPRVYYLCHHDEEHVVCVLPMTESPDSAIGALTNCTMHITC